MHPNLQRNGPEAWTSAEPINDPAGDEHALSLCRDKAELPNLVDSHTGSDIDTTSEAIRNQSDKENSNELAHNKSSSHQSLAEIGRCIHIGQELGHGQDATQAPDLPAVSNTCYDRQRDVVEDLPNSHLRGVEHVEWSTGLSPRSERYHGSALEVASSMKKEFSIRGNIGARPVHTLRSKAQLASRRTARLGNYTFFPANGSSGVCNGGW